MTNHLHHRPIADAQDIMTRFSESPDLSTITADELESAVAGLRTASKSADESVKPYIDAQIAPLEVMLKAKQGRGVDEIDYSDYKSSGLELINRCERFL